MRNFPVLTCLFLTALLTAGCRSEPDAGESPALIGGEGISVEGPWARPAGMGRMSAGYFLLTNFGDEADTLTAVSSEAAHMTEIHESYELDTGMTGMRKVPELVVPAGSTVRFEPGGLHVMFIQLTRALQEGEEFELVLRFAVAGEITVSMPVRS